MKMALMATRLTNEQKHAALSPELLVNIEASPGSGKTTVAAERYGKHRFIEQENKGVVALSFTRSAANELSQRITQRWGTSAISWPHRAITLDTIHFNTLSFLLRKQVIEWPGGHVDIDVLDVWRGQRGFGPLMPHVSWGKAVRLNNRTVEQYSFRIQRPSSGINNRNDYQQHLESGRCTHNEVRQVLEACYADEAIAAIIREYFRTTLKAIIVDEVYDADSFDLAFIEMVLSADIKVTLIGDPWQALYGFRGARPDLVPGIIGNRFTTYPITHSFRFKNDNLNQLTINLRNRQGVNLERTAASEVDVVLASKWDTLWRTDPSVLPLSFGHPSNPTEALLALLVDQVVKRRLAQTAVFSHEAVTILGFERRNYERVASPFIAPALNALRQDNPDSSEKAMAALRRAARRLGNARQFRRLGAENERKQLERLNLLGSRIRYSGKHVPGMTVHQAKGREWSRVGVNLTTTEYRRVRSGLDPDQDKDRVLYVALTRARDLLARI